MTAQLLVRRATCVGADAAGVLSVIMRVRMLARVTAIVVRWVSGHCSSLLLGTQPIAGSLVDGDRASARGDNDVVPGQVVRELLVFEDRDANLAILTVDKNFFHQEPGKPPS